MKIRKKKEKVRGTTFEIQEYEFSEVQEVSSDKFKSRTDLYDQYKKENDISSKKSSILYSKVGNISSKEVSLVTVKDHTRNPLNLVVATMNKIAEMRLNLKAIPILDMIHLHKQTREVIYSDLMKDTLKVSNCNPHYPKKNN